MRRNIEGMLGLFKSKSKRFLVIDFGRDIIKIAYLESSNGGPKLLNYGLKPIVSEGKKEEAVIDFINDFLQRNSILDKDVILNVSEPDSVFINYLELPVLPEREILEAAKWQLKEIIPFNLDSVLIDGMTTREYIDEEGVKKNGIIFIASLREAIDKYLSIINKCNLNPIRLSSNPFNYAHLLKQQLPQSPVSAVLDIGYQDTVLCIYYNQKLNFIRRLTFSSERLTRSLIGISALNKDRAEISFEEAKELRNSFGLPRETDLNLKDNLRASEVISLMRPLLENLIRELKLSFDYFASNFNIPRPETLYLTGGGANLKNLDWYFQEELNIKVSFLSFSGSINTEIDQETLLKDQNQLAGVLGAALAGKEEINLLPSEVKSQKIEFVQRVSLRLVTVSLGTLFLFLFFVAKFQINDYKDRLRNAQRHFKTIEKFKIIKQNIDFKRGLIEGIQKDRIPVDGLLKFVSMLIPKEIILDELNFEQSNHSLVLKGTVSSAEGNSEAVFSNFIERLEASSSFIVEARLASSKMTGETQQFEIECELNH